MRLSRKRADALYDAIREPIIQIRIKVAKDQISKAQMDEALYTLEHQIWLEVTKVLSLVGGQDQ